MAYLSASNITAHTVRITIAGLSNPANQYDQFVVVVNGEYHYWTSVNTNNSTYHDISGLAADSYYTADGAATWAGVPYWMDTIGFTTDPLPQLSTPYLDSYGSTPTGVSISIAPVSHANRYYATCNGQTQYNSTGDFSWSGLVPDTQYQVEYYAVDTYGNYLDSDHAYGYISTVDPTPGVPTNNSNTPGNGEVDVTWNRPASYTYLDGYKFWHRLSGGTWIEDSTVYNTSSTISANFSGLTNGLAYDFACQAFAYEGGEYFYSGLSATVTATPEDLRPDTFDWTYAKWTRGDPSPTLGVEKTFANITEMYVAATEWNALIQNIVDVWDYKGWTDPGLNFVSQGGNMLPSQFNAVKNAIGGHNSTGISDKTDSSNIICTDFNILRTKLNEIV